MHSTQTNVVLGSRPTADHWWRQEGHSVLNARARTKVPSEAPSKPQGIGGNGGKIERDKELWPCQGRMLVLSIRFTNGYMPQWKDFYPYSLHWQILQNCSYHSWRQKCRCFNDCFDPLTEAQVHYLEYFCSLILIHYFYDYLMHYSFRLVVESNQNWSFHFPNNIRHIYTRPLCTDITFLVQLVPVFDSFSKCFTSVFRINLFTPLTLLYTKFPFPPQK